MRKHRRAKNKPIVKSGSTLPHAKVQIGTKRRQVWYVLIPCLAAALVFLPTLRFGFVGDDHAQIERNPQVQSWSYLPRILTTDMWSQKGADHVGFFYRPLFSVWLLLLYSLVGPTPWPWHLASIVLHAIATFLVFQLISKLAKNDLAASLGALVFAIHPIHIEAVSWVSAANELFYTIFVLGSLLLLQESRDDSWDKKSYGALILWAAALFLKETAVVLLAVFAFLTWAKLETLKETGHRGKVAVLRSIPWIVTAGIYLGLRTIVLQRSGLESGKQPWGEALFSAPGLLEFYLKKLVLPWHLSSFYYEDLTSSPQIRMWVAVLLILALVLALFWAAYKRQNAIALSGSLVFLPLLPILGGLRIYEHGNIAHDRYLYLPSAGLCFFVGIVADKFSAKILRRKSIASGIGTIIVSASIYLCLSQQFWYMNDHAYYHRAVELYPQNFLVWELWGRFDLTHKNPKEGLAEITHAYQLAPEDPNVDYYYARALFENERFVEAEPLLKQLSRYNGQRSGRRKIVLLALAQTEIRLVNFLEAENALNTLSQMDDAFPGLHNALGNLYLLGGRVVTARQELMREFELTGDMRSKQLAVTLGGEDK